MADMTAFERQVGDEILSIVGPARTVDDLAIYEAVIDTSRQKGWGLSMSSALKFVTAGVIVALFGGFLLVGVLTTQQGDEMAPAAATESPSPMTSEELLSGMVIEEVAPGVVHVLNDGVRDVAHLGGAVWGEDVVVDDAGAIWRIVGHERYFRLGAEEEWSEQNINPMGFAHGRLVTYEDAMTDLLGPESAAAAGLGPEGEVAAFEAEPDGTLWLHVQDDERLVRVPPGGVPETLSWSDVYDGEDPGGLVVTPDGEAWLMGGRERPIVREEGLDQSQVFLHFDGDEWEVVPVPDGSDYVEPRDYLFDVAPDGTLWTTVGITVPSGGDQPHRTLTRYDGSGWTVFGEADGVRPWGCPPACGWDAPAPGVQAAPDGSAWVIASGPGEDPHDGVGRFDGESWTAYLSGLSIASYDIAPDGAVWVVTRELQDGGVYTDMYVITPEAVTASE
jgi:hypothetical protein